MSVSTDAPARINPWRQFRGSFLPNWLLEVPERLLSARAKLTYARLAQYAGRRGVAYPRQPELARSLGASWRSVKRELLELRRTGLISVVQAGDGKAARYFFHEHPWLIRTPISARPQTAQLKTSARPQVAQLKSPALKDARARPEESHKHEETHRCAGRRPAAANRSHAKSVLKPSSQARRIQNVLDGLTSTLDMGRTLGKGDTTR